MVMASNDNISQSWVMWLMQAGMAVLLGLFGFIWRQLDTVRKEASDEAYRVRAELAVATKRQEDMMQTNIERIRIDTALQNNQMREERKETKAELRQDNLETKDEMRSDMMSMENRIMRALEALSRHRN